MPSASPDRDVACPVREQKHAGENQTGARRPDEDTLPRGKFSRGGRERADMHSVAGREGLQRASGKRGAVQMRLDAAPVGTFLRKYMFHQVRENARRNGGD